MGTFKPITILLFSTRILTLLATVPESKFFPFGEAAGDKILGIGDDNSSPKLYLAHSFPFFDEFHDSLWVNMNGAISFLSAISKYTPTCEPVDREYRMIAPFWLVCNY